MHGLNEIIARNQDAQNQHDKLVTVDAPEGTFTRELQEHVDLYQSQIAAGRQLSDVELFALECAKRLLVISAVPAVWNDHPFYQTRTGR